MKNFYNRLSWIKILILAAIIPFASLLQGQTNTVNKNPNSAPSHSYWSIGAFGGVMQFNEAKNIAMYEKYLTDIIIPKIRKGGMDIIHGYTDII